jgi:mono/diheme cytochrome c family protein
VDARSTGQAASAAPAEAAGKEILQRKCFQCHQASMWSSLRQDRKAWEGVLYRMVGRGALWTEDEIRAMADFLGQTRGPAAGPK